MRFNLRGLLGVLALVSAIAAPASTAAPGNGNGNGGASANAGNPHVDGAAGNPHLDGASGNPHPAGPPGNPGHPTGRSSSGSGSPASSSSGTTSARSSAPAATTRAANANANANGAPKGKITFCHATGSATNPYVLITTSINGYLNGHSKHAGDRLPGPDGTCADPAGRIPSPTPTGRSGGGGAGGAGGSGGSGLGSGTESFQDSGSSPAAQEAVSPDPPAASDDSGSLPFTGEDLGILALLGGAFVAAGMALRRRGAA
jgi:hypothetical protein